MNVIQSAKNDKTAKFSLFIYSVWCGLHFTAYTEYKSAVLLKLAGEFRGTPGIPGNSGEFRGTPGTSGEHFPHDFLVVRKTV